MFGVAKDLVGAVQGAMGLVEQGMALMKGGDKEAGGKLIEQGAQKLGEHQAEISKTSQAHRSRFVAGARPTLIYTGCAILFNHFIVQPYINAIIAGFGGETIPVMDVEYIKAVLWGTAGLGAYRTVEKVTGRAK